MATFGRNFQSQAVDRVARLQTMAEMPFTLSRNLGEQFQQGIVDSFGLGTVVRDIAIPAGNTTRPNPAQAIPGPFGAIAMGYEGARNLINGMRRDQPSLSEDEYRASPYYREEIPYEQGMTEDRAAALATFYDTKQVRAYFGEKRPFSTFVGQLGGQALDPINYVPVFGQAAEAAAIARIGTVAGRALLGAGDAAINTAAFGLLTAGLRDQYGDDTSWQAMTSEIAISALIGGAFGGVSGVISNAYTAARGRADRQVIAAAADRLTDLRSLKEARAVLNEAVGEMAAGRDIGLSPNGQAAVERIQAEVVGEARASRALAEQTASIADGARVVITPAGSRVEIVPEVVELDSLVNASGALQVRNRATQASAAQVEQIATELDPARLMTSVDADSGAPVVGADNVIDSGNGRVMALRRAAEAYPDRYNAYKKALADAGYSLEGLRQPVLVSRRITPLSEDARAKFNAEANAPRAAQMSAVELAAMDRNALDGALDILDASPVTSAGNRAFVQRFLGNLAPSARGALIDGAGNLNADGVRRIENALVAEAYGDVDLGVLRRFAEATDDNTRAIVGAMSDVAGKWALMRRDVKLGNISPEFDMTAELTEALRLIGGWREQAAREGRPVSMVIREGMAQLDLLSGEISPETQAMVSAFYQTNSFARAAGRDTIAELLSRIVDAAQELGRPQLFGDLETTKLEVLRYAASNEQGNLFTPVGTVDGIEADGGFDRTSPLAADRQDGGQGSRADRAANDDGLTVPRVGQPVAVRNLPPELEAKALNDFLATQPARSLDDLYAVAQTHQDELGSIGALLGQQTGAEFRDPGLKGKATSAEKMARKRYDSTSRLTDVVRAGYVVAKPGQVDDIIAGLAQRFRVLDEGWRMTEAGYFDRKAMVQFDDGTIGEVQFWHPDLLARKDGQGHALYEEMRTATDPTRKMELLNEQRRVYLAALDAIEDDWLPVVDQLLDEVSEDVAAMSGRPASGNMRSNVASGTARPDSTTSANSTGSQAPAADTTAQARPSSDAAGRPSQSKNTTAETPVATDSTLAPNDADDAAKRVGKDESLRETAMAHGVDPNTGEFVEQGDIAQIREEGRLTPQDEADLADADALFADAEAYGRALDAAVRCVI